MKSIKLFCLTLLLIICSARALAVELDLGAELNYFDPTDEDFRQFYEGGLCYGLESRLWFENGFGLGSSIDYLTRTKIYAGDEFKVESLLWNSSLLYSMKGIKWLRPYFGAGLVVDYSRESNKADTIDDWDLGYQAQAGVEIILKYFRPYLQISVQETPETDGINLSGYMTGIGVQFQLPIKKSESKPE